MPPTPPPPQPPKPRAKQHPTREEWIALNQELGWLSGSVHDLEDQLWREHKLTVFLLGAVIGLAISVVAMRGEVAELAAKVAEGVGRRA